MKNIIDIAKKINIKEKDCYRYGNYMAKIQPCNFTKKGKLILVTAITPTPAGEGKTTTTIALGDALNRLNKKALICLREPSMGPVFGLKGGATGGGMHSVVPKEEINLHFTGDMHALTSANNLICAVIDSIIFHGNELNIDKNQILIHRIIDMNDRALRNVLINYNNDNARVDHFDITVASELMAILCLAKNEKDFEQRINDMHVANTIDNKPIFLKDLNITGSIMAIMKHALKPNLVQTIEENPVLIHGGPFANIAHGCNSVIATNTALSLADYVVTEAGFGSDLGFEKFLDIKARQNDLNIACVVLVATIRALKMHGGVSLDQLEQNNPQAIELGFDNLLQHFTNISNSNLPIVINLNQFTTDTDEEIEMFKKLCDANNLRFAISNGFNSGSEQVLDLANQVLSALDEEPKQINFNYDLEDSIVTKLEKIVTKTYGGKGISLTDEAREELEAIEKTEAINFPICIAKTPNSFSGNPKLLNAPKDFLIEFSHFKVNFGAKFVVCYASQIMTMPGLGKNSQVFRIEYQDGEIKNLD